MNSILEKMEVDTEIYKQVVDRFNSLEQRLSVCLLEAGNSGTLHENLSVVEGVG